MPSIFSQEFPVADQLPPWGRGKNIFPTRLIVLHIESLPHEHGREAPGEHAEQPAGPRDWRIENLITVAGRFGIEVRNPGGSHHISSFPGVELAVCIPAHRPIKPVYIRQFIALVDQARGKNP